MNNDKKIVCGSIFTRTDFEDISGCLKPNGHNDYHVCKTKDGDFVAWEDDYNCKCGCWDDYENDEEVCMVYWKVIDFKKI